MGRWVGGFIIPAFLVGGYAYTYVHTHVRARTRAYTHTYIRARIGAHMHPLFCVGVKHFLRSEPKPLNPIPCPPTRGEPFLDP